MAKTTGCIIEAVTDVLLKTYLRITWKGGDWIKTKTFQAVMTLTHAVQTVGICVLLANLTGCDRVNFFLKMRLTSDDL